MSEDWATSYGFSPAKRAGNLVFISGCIGMNEEGVMPTDAAAQYKVVFSNLNAVLKSQGLSAEDLVEMVSYHTSYPANMEAFMAAKAEFLGTSLPSWTAIGAAALGTPETLVEIKAVAMVRA